MKARFLVSLDLPSGVSLEQMRQYIEEEIKTNIGRLPPDEPLFDLDRDSVKVSVRR